MRPFPGSGGRWQVSNEGGTEPEWAPSGRELLYRSGTSISVVNITPSGAGLAAGAPRKLFEGAYGAFIGVASNGQQLLLTKAGAQQNTTFSELVFVQNWSEELKRLVPRR